MSSDLIYDKEGNIIPTPDLEKGYIIDMQFLKEDAIPIDNVNKFAWDMKNDFFTRKTYIPYDKEELERRHQSKILDVKEKLLDTDYISSKAMDAIFQCETPEEILQVTGYYKDKYSDIIEQRQEWRDEINELNNKFRKEEKR